MLTKTRLGWVTPTTKAQITFAKFVKPELTYYANGNVLTYGDKSFTWNSGRNLATITDSSNNDSISYTYNRYGYRTSKTVSGVTTHFTVDENGTVVAQKTGNDTLYFEYDNYGSPLGFVYNGIQYLYITNIRNDVIAITDTAGVVLASYTYGDWGECTVDSTSTNLALANLNPLRYRGYYYDNETGYYYLQSRYYDPSICRFVNSDIAEISQMSKDIPVGNNLFAYCNNDPVNNSDPTGKISIKFIGFGIQICVSIGRVVAGLEYIFYKKDSKWNTALFAFLGGSTNFKNVTKAYNKILYGIKSIRTGFSFKKLLSLPSISVSGFVILGNKNVSIYDYEGWFTTLGASYRNFSVGVSYSHSYNKGTKKIIGSIAFGLTTRKMLSFSFSQTMYFKYSKYDNSFNVLKTLRNNIYNKVAWLKLAGALIL